jgi:peptide-methionine (R)-S-oxide reductase
MTGKHDTPAAETVEIFDPADGSIRRVPRVVRSNAQWRALLPREVYEVTRRGGTERPFTGHCWNSHAAGLYRCACCRTALFASGAKFDSGTGWPSYTQPVSPLNIRTREDHSFVMVRTEVRCARCDAHLGHVFPDGPPPTGLRYCINAAALIVQPEPIAERRDVSP